MCDTNSFEGDQDMLPYKIVDGAREKRFGVVASSLKELIEKASEKLGLSGYLKVVLEADGTEVDEEDYFSTLEKNTSLMILNNDEKWALPGRFRFDEVDASGSGRGIKSLLQRLQGDIGQVTLLGGCELELLSDMDPDSLKDIVPDRNFLDSLKEASGRFLKDKRDAQDAMDLLKIYHNQQIKGTLAQ